MERRLKAAVGRGPAAWLGLLLLALPASAQLSPGELSRAHADLEGSRGCLRCHESGRGWTVEDLRRIREGLELLQEVVLRVRRRQPLPEPGDLCARIAEPTS